MTPEQWQRVEAIFAGTAGLSRDEVDDYLNRECGADAGLRREVESLLSYESTDDRLLKNVVVQAAEMISITRTEVRQEMAGKRVGTRIGHYLLKQVIGFGGMGVVYLGVRDDAQMQKKVAVKLLQHGRDTKFIRDRFRQERQILAQLEHPNIARFIDGGVTADDLPYYVMEYVEDGEPVSDYCRKKNLEVAQRLALFQQVCAAVNYAHRNLVVHRDLKPGNILVDRDGAIKLLDFGIAKVLSEEGAMGGKQTQTVVRMLTPDYASPEQVNGHIITTATDVYSLGVILYEMLSGQPAHRFKNYSNTEIERVVCMEDPLRPSAAALLGDWSQDKERMARSISGDLDSIVAMAMRKEPERRYGSVEQFSLDVENFVSGRPVLAHKGTVRYRAGKFVRRHRMGIAAAAMIMLTLAGGIATTLYQARRSERRFQQVRQLANTLLIDFDKRIASLPQSIELRQWMTATVVHYLDNLVADAGSDDGLQMELAQSYYKVAQLESAQFQANLGQSQEATEHYRKSVEIFTKVAQRREDVTVLTGLCNAMQMLGQTEAFSGNMSAARPVLEQALQYADKLQRVDPRAGNECLSGCYAGLVAVEMGSANARGAIPFVNRQLDAARTRAALEKSPAAQESVLSALANLAAAQLETGDPVSSIRTSGEIMATGSKVFGPAWENHDLRFRILATMGSLAGNPRDINLVDKASAVSHYNEALRIAEWNYARDAQDARYRRDVDRMLRRLALLVVDDDPDRAEKLAQRARKLSEIHLRSSPKNPEYIRDNVDAILILAYAQQARKNPQGALPLLEKALAMQLDAQRNSPETRRFKREIQETYQSLGDVYLSLHREKEALAQYERGLELTVGMLWERPADAYLLRDLTDNHEALAGYFAAIAAQGGTQAPVNWKKAIEHQKESVNRWAEWPRKVAGGPYPEWRIEKARNTIAAYEKAAAKFR